MARHTDPPTNGKRKQPTTAGNASSSSDDDDDDQDIVNVDFEWFDPQEHDFHGLKLLLRQLFDVDAQLFDLSALANLILSQPLLGSTVKCPEDGLETRETDPFAFLTVLNLQAHKEKKEVQSLTEYLRKKAAGVPKLAALGQLLDEKSEAQVGLILGERFINMPAEIVPPMYKMLIEEMQWAVEEQEPYRFTHYLVLSKTYTEVASKLDGEVIMESSTGPPSKKSKRAKGGSSVKAETFYFHPEDEALQRHASGFGDFLYDKQAAEGASDSKRAFQEAGIDPVGHLILIEADKLAGAVTAVEQYISPTA